MSEQKRDTTMYEQIIFHNHRRGVQNTPQLNPNQMKRFLLSLGVVAMAATSVFAETQTVTVTKFDNFKNDAGRASDNILPGVYTYSQDGAKFIYSGLKKTPALASTGMSLASGKGYWFALAECPENATISSISFPTFYEYGDLVTVHYSETPITSDPKNLPSFTVPQGNVTADFKTVAGGAAAKAKYFALTNQSSGNFAFNVPFTVTFDIAAATVQQLQAPEICGPDGALVGGEVLPAGTGLWFNNLNEKGSIYFATSTDNGATWSDYTVYDWEGAKVSGEPGARFGVRAYVKGDVEGEDSAVTELYVTVAEKWTTPTITFGDTTLEGDTYISLATMTAGDKLTIVNPNPNAYVHVEMGETVVDGELGQNYVYTVPEALEEAGRPIEIYASIQGEGKANSATVYVAINSIHLRAPRIEDANGMLLKRGVPVASGSYVYFTNPNSKGTVYAATCVDGVWGTYTEIAEGDGLELTGLPGATIEVGAYVKGDDLSLTSTTTVAQVTFMEEWDMPTYMYDGVALASGSDVELAEAQAGKVITVVNPTELGKLTVTVDGETFMLEPGENFDITVPDALPVAGEAWMIESKVTGNENADSVVATLYVMSIVGAGNEGDIDTSVAGINAENGKALYFNLQGQQVSKPENGCYIVVKNGKAVKVVK